MKKLNENEYQAYWKRVHASTKNNLAAVCFPDKSFSFNLFFDRTQKYAIRRSVLTIPGAFKGKRVLDIGCGRGRWPTYFRERFGTQVVGIDISQDAVQACQAMGLEAYVHSATELPFPDESFDIVTSITVLLHLPMEEKQKAIQEISRVLRRDGRAVLLESTWKKDPSPHVFGLSLSQWKDLFREAHLRLAHVSAHYFNLFRRSIGTIFPLFETLTIYLDYPLEYLLMYLYRGKDSRLALQHIMIFEKSAQE